MNTKSNNGTNRSKDTEIKDGFPHCRDNIQILITLRLINLLRNKSLLLK